MFYQYTYTSLLLLDNYEKKLGILSDHQFEINLLYLSRLPLVNKSMCFMK